MSQEIGQYGATATYQATSDYPVQSAVQMSSLNRPNAKSLQPQNSSLKTRVNLLLNVKQHVDIGLSRVHRDCSDLQKILVWLQANDHFTEADSRLRSLSAGLVADEGDNLTCDSVAIHDLQSKMGAFQFLG